MRWNVKNFKIWLVVRWQQDAKIIIGKPFIRHFVHKRHMEAVLDVWKTYCRTFIHKNQVFFNSRHDCLDLGEVWNDRWLHIHEPNSSLNVA